MSVANSYAKALYEAVQERGLSAEDTQQIEAQMDLFQSMMENSKDAQVALYGPLTTAREKIEVIQEFAKKLELSQLLSEFLVLLTKKKRLSILSRIKDSFGSIRLTLDGGVAGKLVAAEPMSDVDIGTLVKVFSHKFGKKVTFRVSTDPSLLAGMKVTVNGVTYDGTLRSQLLKLRDSFVAGLPGAH